MSLYLHYSGIAFNVVLFGFLALCLWVWIIHPIAESISQFRWYKACASEYPHIKLVPWYKLILLNIDWFGRLYDRKSHRYGEWSGIGKWQVYRSENEFIDDEWDHFE